MACLLLNFIKVKLDDMFFVSCDSSTLLQYYVVILAEVRLYPALGYFIMWERVVFRMDCVLAGEALTAILNASREAG